MHTRSCARRTLTAAVKSGAASSLAHRRHHRLRRGHQASGAARGCLRRGRSATCPPPARVTFACAASLPYVWRGHSRRIDTRDARCGAVWAGQRTAREATHPSRSKTKSRVWTLCREGAHGMYSICVFFSIMHTWCTPLPAARPAVPRRHAGRATVQSHERAVARARSAPPARQLVLSAPPARQVHGSPVRGRHEARSALPRVQRLDVHERCATAKREAVLPLARDRVHALRRDDDSRCVVQCVQS